MKRRNEELLVLILEEFRKDSSITEKYLSAKYNCHERTIRRYIKILKEQNLIKLKVNGKNKQWIVISK